MSQDRQPVGPYSYNGRRIEARFIGSGTGQARMSRPGIGCWHFFIDDRDGGPQLDDEVEGDDVRAMLEKWADAQIALDRMRSG